MQVGEHRLKSIFSSFFDILKICRVMRVAGSRVDNG